MTTSEKIRLAFIVALWIVVTTRPFTAWVAFVIVASGIIVFVPLYKKYRKNKK